MKQCGIIVQSLMNLKRKEEKRNTENNNKKS